MRNLKLIGYKVNEMNFRINPDISGNNFKINPKIRMDLKQNVKSLLLVVTVTIDKFQESATPFELIVSLAANFEITNQADIDSIRIEAAEIAFPYVRSVISHLTLLANMPAYVLPTIDFASAPVSNESGAPASQPVDSPKSSITITPLEDF